MNDKETMKLALEALEQIARRTGPRWALENSYAGHLEAITNIKEALAQTEQKRPQNCGTGYCSCIECVMTPSPRAWLIEFEDGDEELHFDEQSVGEIHVPLYTAPPQPKQEPLTDEAIYAMCDDFHGWSEWDGGEYQRLWLNLCRAIEAAHDIKE
jgi:hypothetical protein